MSHRQSPPRSRRARATLLALTALIAAGSFDIAEAACPFAYLIGAQSKQIVSNPNWCGGATGYCYSESRNPGDEAPIGRGFDALFWSMGTGDPAPGSGDDSGTWSSNNWIDTYFVPEIGYYRNVWLKSGTNWAQSFFEIDGCVDGAGATGVNDGDECTCIGFFDQWPVPDRGPSGMFAVAGDQRDQGGNFEFAPWIPDGTLRLAPVPPAIISGSTRLDGAVDVVVGVEHDGSGLYIDAACQGCGELRYVVYEYQVERGRPLPDGRKADAVWTRSLLANGEPQSPLGTALGETVTVRATCERATQAHFAIQLVLDSGFVTEFVSAASEPIGCAPDRPGRPNPLDVKPIRGKPGNKEFGRR